MAERCGEQCTSLNRELHREGNNTGYECVRNWICNIKPLIPYHQPDFHLLHPAFIYKALVIKI